MSCRNCGAEVPGEFCAACGQRAIDPDPTLREFLHEAAEELLHWDGKLAATFRQVQDILNKQDPVWVPVNQAYDNTYTRNDIGNFVPNPLTGGVVDLYPLRRL